MSKDEFEITFSDVRVIANASEDNTIQLCDSSCYSFARLKKAVAFSVVANFISSKDSCRFNAICEAT